MAIENPYQTPATASGAVASPGKMPVARILFCFKGRIPRRSYWLWSFLTIIPGLAIFIAVVALAAPPVHPPPEVPPEQALFGKRSQLVPRHSLADDLASEPKFRAIFAGAFAVVFIPLTWTSLALGIKRWHDRGKSGWWTLINLVPVIGATWTFVECGCLRGSREDNAYGPAPT